jgi:hypothetical protein
MPRGREHVPEHALILRIESVLGRQGEESGDDFGRIRMGHLHVLIVELP